MPVFRRLLLLLRAVYRFAGSLFGGILIILALMFFVVQGFVIPSRSMVGSLYEGDVLLVKKFSYGISLPRLPWINTVIFPDIFGNGHLIEGARPKRGDIVVFIPPTQNNNFVKRMFARGGDEVIFAREGLFLHAAEGNEATRALDPKAKTISFAGKTFVLNPFAHLFPGIHYRRNNALYHYFAQLANDPKNYTADPEAPISGVSMRPITLANELAFHKKIPHDEFFMIGDNRDNSDDSRVWGSVKYSNIIGRPWLVLFSISLSNSLETHADTTPSARFVPRWDRSFVRVENLRVIPETPAL